MPAFFASHASMSSSIHATRFGASWKGLGKPPSVIIL
ncbi:hypothetical protein Y046_6276 [Burkholderia pseudomallei MSHR2990]|nr:hypothetical protein Y046_6276 [Burkholderia pseudomallei MSHR2990]